MGSSPGKWPPTFSKSSVWDLGWRAVPTTNLFLKIDVPIQVLMPGLKPKPNSNSFLHILHVRLWEIAWGELRWEGYGSDERVDGG